MIDILAPFRRTPGTDAGPAGTPIRDSQRGRGSVIAVANEKGGCGKSTMAMHLAIALMKQGKRVATMDLDLRQGSLNRYVANRRRYARAAKAGVAIPEHFSGAAVTAADGHDESQTAVPPSDLGLERLRYVIDGSRANVDILIVDTPGADTPHGRLSHQLADLILTPVNDSFIDLDVLAQIDPHRKTVVAPSAFAAMLLSDRQNRLEKGLDPAPWLVARNRIGTLESHNARDVDWALDMLVGTIGIEIVPGFSERVIFRELFLVGLTILDLKDASGGQPLSRSHLAARKEVTTMADAVLERLPDRRPLPT